jgi:hypothetical protein
MTLIVGYQSTVSDYSRRRDQNICIADQLAALVELRIYVRRLGYHFTGQVKD